MDLKTQIISSDKYNDYTYIYVFGDSHCLCFGQGDTIIDNKYNVQMLNRDSASARGLSNKNSTLNYSADIAKFIYLKKSFGDKPNNSDETKNVYLFKFGQVDVQINYYYKLIVKKENVIKKIFFEEIINDYMYFVEQFSKSYNVLICGINLPNSAHYKEYLINCFNVKDEMEMKLVNSEISKITLEEMNADTLLFNELLKNACEHKSIKYFDLTYECAMIIDNNVMLNPEYIGTDHHYNGCIGLNRIQNNIKIYNDLNNIEQNDYVNHPLYKKTYYTFFNKLINTLKNTNFTNVYTKNISLLYLLNNIHNVYIFHNNIIKYKLITQSNEIIINIDEILSQNNNLDPNMEIFGINIRGVPLTNFNAKIELQANLPMKIFDGKKWVRYDTNIISEDIFIKNVNKWRISISNDFLKKNLNEKNIVFSVKILNFTLW